MRTRDKLVRDLKANNAPAKMIEFAEYGFYDDYDSPIATPIMRLVADCETAGLEKLALSAKNGEYDATKEEAEEWFNSKGRDLLK